LLKESYKETTNEPSLGVGWQKSPCPNYAPKTFVVLGTLYPATAGTRTASVFHAASV